MIVFTLHKKTGRANFPISVESNNVERKMFALLFDYVGIDIAIDASSWCAENSMLVAPHARYIVTQRKKL